MVTSNGEVLVSPGLGNGLLTRYTSDLTDPEPVLERPYSKHRVHRDSRFALDRRDNLYWLDNVDLTVKVFDRDLNQTGQWSVDPPGLRADLEERLEALVEEFGDRPVTIRPIIRMTLSADGRHMLLTYKMARLDARVAYVYSLDGRLVDQYQLEGIVMAASLDPQGVIIAVDGDSLSFSVGTPVSTSNSP
jgi:hypothetical protein